MDNNQPVSPRRRLQTLLAIPDNQRTEAQWDEIVELEITLAPGNREDGPGRDMRTAPVQQHRKPNRSEGGGNPGGGGGGGGGGQKHNKSPRKPRGKPNKPPKPETT
jgi:hypothetical protein